jgi:hypothetical protein
MTTMDDHVRPDPRRELLSTRFRVQGPMQRPLRCGVYRIGTGLELRLEYEDLDDLQRSQWFSAADWVATAALADEWHRALRRKGFDELPL